MLSSLFIGVEHMKNFASKNEVIGGVVALPMCESQFTQCYTLELASERAPFEPCVKKCCVFYCAMLRNLENE